MKIAITGASGSIGSIVVELALKQGHAVVAIDQTAPKKEANGKDYSFVKVDLCNYDDVLEHLRGCDAVISLAAIRTPEDYQVKAHNTSVVSAIVAIET
jgi:nucleoside-diphosphate-sugar epimerase